MAWTITSSYPTHFGGGGGHGLTFLDIPGLVWDTVWNCTERALPCGRQAVIFPPSLATNNLRQICPGGDQTGVLPPFLRSPPLSLLLRLQCKRLALWEEVSSLLNKRVMEIVDLSRDQGDFIPITSWLPSALVGFAQS